LATSKAPKVSLLLGPQYWTIHKDSKACSESEAYSVRLKLTGCDDDEFTCDDATCVPMAVRCDAKGDCPDGSDEATCTTIITSVGYHKANVPPPPAGRGKKFKLNFAIDLFHIVEVNEKLGYFKTKLDLERSWIDRKLTFRNLKKNIPMVVDPEDMQRIWKPWTIFRNLELDNKYDTTLGFDKIKIKPNADYLFKQADSNHIDNTYLFEGKDNLIIYERQVGAEWLCDFNMMWYPFDTQVCNMQLQNLDDSVDYVPKNMTYSGPMDLAGHYVRDFKMCLDPHPIDGKQGIVVEVVFGRPLFSHLLTTTIPTVILIVISQMATMFAKEFIDMVIMVNLTVLLVLATL
jgi:hypothetical protein